MKKCEICGETKGRIIGKNGRYKTDLCRKHYTQMSIHGHTFERTIFSPNEFIIDEKEGVVEIVIYNKKNEEINRTIVNIRYVDIVKNYKWCIASEGYVMGQNNGKQVRLHRLITNCPENMVVDHINHNKLDNLDNNLRICTKSENGWNRTIHNNNTSGVPGVYWNKSNSKWMSIIIVDKKRIYLGVFVDINDAIAARKDAEEKYFGDFAYKSELTAYES